MKSGEPGGEQAVRMISTASPFYPDDPSAWAWGEVLRLLLAPIIVTMLFVGGIYWIKWQLPSGRSGQDQASTVQVRLLPRPGPEPVPVSEISPPSLARVAAQTDDAADRPDKPIEDAAVTPVPSAPAAAEAPAVISRPVASDGPPNVAAIKFRQDLLRHVARYQRYPKAARRERLYGSVDTIFSMRRDGTVLGVWVRSSSGQPIFDKEAVDTIWRAQPLPAVPSDLPDPLTVETTLVFEPS
ncbi:energy transducer TonB [Bradyrhizobium sp. STM 3562]|uniref:energy transducer TonB n=1 Tax=Bradyrhizobium sp. STM 3562 TaxID=578924 RepID=UPI00388E0C96